MARYKPISDYGIIGNLRSVALVGLDGAIDWYCHPWIDSPSVFAALLDCEKGGTFFVRPVGEYDATAHYIHRTNVLQTLFRTREGVARLTDFMALPYGGDEDAVCAECSHYLYRKVEVVHGSMELDIRFAPRFDYARAETQVESVAGGAMARGGGECLALTATRKLQTAAEEAHGRWRLGKGEEAWLRLGAMPDGDAAQAGPPVSAREGEDALADTAEFWRDWVSRSETGRTVQFGPFCDMAERSALTLKLLSYTPTGAIAAAATTSLPETIGGGRNWDYRYTWVRDASFTLQALFNLGHLSETEGFLHWLETLLSEHGAGAMQIMYSVRGDEDLPEIELNHLDGYKGSRPVRIGNGAAAQVQMDIYGELMDSATLLSDYVGRVDEKLWPFLRGVCDHVADHWTQRDNGIWEVRGGPFHFVYSKAMCWVALDRGVTIARRYGFPGDVDRWKAEAEAIREEVLEKGWCDEKHGFRQHYETDVQDASNLLLPLMGFLAWDDERTALMVDAAAEELTEGGFLKRYVGPDGLEGEEGTFFLCTFWYIDCLIGLGRLEEAETLLRKAEQTANHLGLFAEEYDPLWREALGNFPQAFTHIGYINSAMRLQKAKARKNATEASGKPKNRAARGILASTAILNEGEPDTRVEPDTLAAELKRTMNLLRGAFFDTRQGRVAYERMAHSDLYAKYLDLSRNLQRFDPSRLTGREERTAFWINLYNVLVIHGVVALGVRDSVKEVRNFFDRVAYDIGGQRCTPDIIEHGILRSNRKPPHSFFRVLPSSDERTGWSLAEEEFDPRIHFGLVCASSSCPPIEMYTAEELDRELDLSGRTFLNGGGVNVELGPRRVELSRIFKWYASDFGGVEAERLRFVAGFLYDDETRTALENDAESFDVSYQKYDWRLNRD